MSTLSERLGRLRAAGKAPAAVAAPGAASGDGSGAPPPGSGWKRVEACLWERCIDRSAVLPGILDSGFVLPEGTAAEKPVFYDLETTGLSGGAGNTAFLIGLGFQRGDIFSVVQLFLADYPGEAAMLERYAELVGEDRPQVSYNGRSFDSQVLRTRFLLNRMAPLFLPQADLLYPARRLWGSVLPNAALGTLEGDVLGFYREDDLPGREAPDAWFSWLRGIPGRIGGVFRHNADDIVSLARLLARMEEWGRIDPGHYTDARRLGLPEGTPVSAMGMARQWAPRDADRERLWLEAGWAVGEPRCGRELAVRRRREGDYSGARAVWEELNAGGRDFAAAVELAKDWEHRLKDASMALTALSGLDGLPLSDRRRRELEHRRRRLRAKAEQAGRTAFGSESPDGPLEDRFV